MQFARTYLLFVLVRLLKMGRSFEFEGGSVFFFVSFVISMENHLPQIISGMSGKPLSRNFNDIVKF